MRQLQQIMAFGAELSAARIAQSDLRPALIAMQAVTAARHVALVRFSRKSPPELQLSTAETTADRAMINMAAAAFSQSAIFAPVASSATIQASETQDGMFAVLERTRESVKCLVTVWGRDTDRQLCRAVSRQAAELWAAGVKFSYVPSAPVVAPLSDILADSNPCALTRAEFRICREVGEGYRPADIAERLGSSIWTVRSHLRSIYAKTETEGLVALTFRLAKAAKRVGARS